MRRTRIFALVAPLTLGLGVVGGYYAGFNARGERVIELSAAPRSLARDPYLPTVEERRAAEYRTDDCRAAAANTALPAEVSHSLPAIEEIREAVGQPLKSKLAELNADVARVQTWAPSGRQPASGAARKTPSEAPGFLAILSRVAEQAAAKEQFANSVAQAVHQSPDPVESNPLTRAAAALERQAAESEEAGDEERADDLRELAHKVRREARRAKNIAGPKAEECSKAEPPRS